MEQGQSTTKVAGIDVGKHRLDAAVHGSDEAGAFANTPAGIGELIAWLRAGGVVRAGLEATGGYERDLRAALQTAGLEVVVHQPMQVRRFAQFRRLKAKNDRLDAALIAAATAQLDTLGAAQDPRLDALAQELSAYEHVTDQIVQTKTFLEKLGGQIPAARDLRALLASLQRLKARIAERLIAQIKAHADLLDRFKLLMSLPGVGRIVAASLAIRMPELGQMKRGQAASLIGVAPFDRDSGQHKGQRFITGGRSRPRRMLYLAATVAKRHDPALRAFAQQLKARGKPPKVVTVAVMRKLIEAANLVLARQHPWLKTAAA